MINLLVKSHIYHRAKELGFKRPDNINDILLQYNKLEQLGNNRIIYSYFKDGNAKYLAAGAILHNIILVNAEWAARLVLYNNEYTKNAFLITIGHELTHKDNDFPLRNTFGSNRKFIHWVNEVHADFGGASKMVNCNRKILVASIEYKRALKKKDYESSTHPSWSLRKTYAQNYNFNDTLISIIADKTKCKNSKLIEQVKNHYKPIILT